MHTRTLGRTGLEVSALSFGCGAVGGLMVRGALADQERAVARALQAGIRYVDTAALYGNGQSEINTGRVLKALRAEVLLGTKVRLAATDRPRLGEGVARSMDQSLRRLGRDHVDVFYLHNFIAPADAGEALSPETVLAEVVPTFERLRAAGKTRCIGFTAIGDTASLHRLVASGRFDAAQVVYNALNPSAGVPLPAGYPAQDYAGLATAARKAGMATLGIRILAAGALSGSEQRHPTGMPSVEPIGSGADYGRDVARAQRLMPMVAEGHAGSLVELALRFAISGGALSTAIFGLSTLEELESAIAAAAKGPLSGPALARLAELQKGFVGEAR